MKKFENLRRRLHYYIDAFGKEENVSYFEYSDEGKKSLAFVEAVRDLYNVAKCEPPSISLATSVARLFDAYVRFYEELGPYDSDIPNPDEIFGDLKISELFGSVDIAEKHIHKTQSPERLVRYNAYFSFLFSGERYSPYKAYLLCKSE